jgi:hypothetical protein
MSTDVCTGQTAYVGLVEALAHPDRQARRLLDMGATWPNSGPEKLPEPVPYRTQRQLQPAEVDQVVEAYQVGATALELASRFGVYRTTIGKHLQSRGIDTSPPALLPENINQTVRLYQEGWSLTRLGDRFGVSANTVKAYLLAAGVMMRPKGRQPKAR